MAEMDGTYDRGTTGPDAPLWPGVGLILAVLALVAGLGYGGLETYQAWRAPDGFSRSVAGGAMSVSLAAGEGAVIYAERGMVPTQGDLGLSVRSPDGADMALTPYDGTLQYDRPDGLGTAVARFTASEPGVYLVSSNAGGAGLVPLAIGQDIGRRIAEGTVRAAAFIGLGVLVGLLSVLGARRRTGSSRT